MSDRLKMTVNGRKVDKPAAGRYRLLDFLRDDLNLTGAKEGCGAGECGTCLVFVDGKLSSPASCRRLRPMAR